MRRIVGWSLLGWLLVVPCAVANGALRQGLLIPWWGTAIAQPVSGLLLIAIIAAIVAWMVERIGPQPARVFVVVGCGWLVATFLFELGLGLAAGRPPAELLAAYRFADHDLWPLVMLWVAVAPWLIARWRGLVRSRD